MNPESFLALTARNAHPVFLLSTEGSVVAANPSGSAVLGCEGRCKGTDLDLRDFVEDPPEAFLANLQSWASAGVPINRPIRLRAVDGRKTRYRGEGLRVVRFDGEATPLVLLHCVPLDPAQAREPAAEPNRGRVHCDRSRPRGTAADPTPESTKAPDARDRRTTRDRRATPDRRASPQRCATEDPPVESGGPEKPEKPDRPATPATPATPTRPVGKMEAMGNLSAGIAHDFNNLLTVMKVEIELAMEQGDLPAAVVDSLLSTHAAVVRAETLISGLLAFSRRQHLLTSEADLRTLVEDAMPRVRAVTGATQPVVTRAPRPLPVQVDAEHVETVVLALVRNAVEASEQGTPIQIRTRREVLGPDFVSANEGSSEGAFAVLEVEDRGTGITTDVQARMFEPFFTTKGRGYGRGLGLAQAFGLVKILGGYLKVDSTLGSGSTFAVFLPLHEPEDGSSEAETGPDEPEPASET
ncbi:MAG: ATP-binding protein [Gemmatimonadota bacterium]